MRAVARMSPILRTNLPPNVIALRSEDVLHPSPKP